MYKRILVPLDGSELAEQVLPYARALAKGLSASLDLLEVIEPPPSQWADSAHGVYPHRLADSLKNTARDYLERVAVPLRREGLSAVTNVRKGSPPQCIAAEAELEPDTLIAMSSHGRSGIARWVLGSVTDKVLQDTSCPLLIVRASEEGAVSSPARIANLIVPQDGSALAEQALPHAAALARPLRSKVHLVRANHSLGEYHNYMGLYPLDSSSNVYHEMYQEFAKESDARAMEQLHDVKDRLRDMGITSVEENLLKGHAAEVIVDLAKETANCLIVMSSHGRSGIGRWVLGSVSDRVVRHSGVPVLIIRATEEEVPHGHEI